MKAKNEIVLFDVLPVIQLPKDYSVDAASVEQRDLLVIKAKGLKPIVDVESDSVAVSVGVEIRRAIKAVDEGFARLNRPLIDARTLLKTLRDNYVKPLQDEQTRLELQSGTFRRAENERVERERQKQAAEERRLRLEAEEAQRKADEAALKAKGKVTLAKAMEAQQAATTAQEQFMTAVAKPVAEVEKPRGSTFRQVPRHIVLDIQKVYEANPKLCKPLEISPSAVKALCSPAKGSTKENPDKSVPGLSLFWEDDMGFSAR